jgi:hypothetical protein
MGFPFLSKPKLSAKIFVVLFAHDARYVAAHDVAKSDLRVPLRDLYAQHFKFYISDYALGCLCDLYYRWWYSIRSPSNFPRITLSELIAANTLIGEGGILTSIEHKEEFFAIYSADQLTDMYRAVPPLQ